MAKRKGGGWLETVKTIVYAGLIAIGIRTFAFEPFNIPSSSMVPTLLVGDYLFVSKFSYGYSRYSLPFSPPLWQGRLFLSMPERGDVAVFRWPRDNATDYIKRIVGLPGDRIQVIGGILYINGEAARREPAGLCEDDGTGVRIRSRRWLETLPAAAGGRQHHICEFSDTERFDNTEEFRVPPGHVFAMGDNRDNSSDSRDFSAAGVGYIPIENLIGRAEIIFFSHEGTAFNPLNWRLGRFLDRVR
jgi:signal peptidase I